MPFPFGKSHKSPADIVKNLKDSMTVLEKHDISDKKAEKVGESALTGSIASEASVGAVKVIWLFSKLDLPVLYYCVCVCDLGHRGGVKKPGVHEGDLIWD